MRIDKLGILRPHYVYSVGDSVHLYSIEGIYVIRAINTVGVIITCAKWLAEYQRGDRKDWCKFIKLEDIKCPYNAKRINELIAAQIVMEEELVQYEANTYEGTKIEKDHGVVYVAANVRQNEFNSYTILQEIMSREYDLKSADICSVRTHWDIEQVTVYFKIVPATARTSETYPFHKIIFKEA